MKTKLILILAGLALCSCASNPDTVIIKNPSGDVIATGTITRHPTFNEKYIWPALGLGAAAGTWH